MLISIQKNQNYIFVSSKLSLFQYLNTTSITTSDNSGMNSTNNLVLESVIRLADTGERTQFKS